MLSIVLSGLIEIGVLDWKHCLDCVFEQKWKQSLAFYNHELKLRWRLFLRDFKPIYFSLARRRNVVLISRWETRKGN